MSALSLCKIENERFLLMKNQRIVNLRAIAIILVVLGHSIILYSSNWNLYQTNVTCPPLDNLKKFIDVVQMPLFFSLSGYLFWYSQKKKKPFDTFVLDKIKRLVIPYLVFAIAWLLPIRLLLNIRAIQVWEFCQLLLKRFS